MSLQSGRPDRRRRDGLATLHTDQDHLDSSTNTTGQSESESPLCSGRAWSDVGTDFLQAEKAPASNVSVTRLISHLFNPYSPARPHGLTSSLLAPHRVPDPLRTAILRR